jgi:hypothetical protein
MKIGPGTPGVSIAGAGVGVVAAGLAVGACIGTPVGLGPSVGLRCCTGAVAGAMAGCSDGVKAEHSGSWNIGKSSSRGSGLSEDGAGGCRKSVSDNEAGGGSRMGVETGTGIWFESAVRGQCAD